MSSPDTTRTGTDAERQALHALRRMRERLESIESARREPIAVVGMACRLPGAPDVDAYWDVLRSGRDAVRDVPAGRWPGLSQSARAGRVRPPARAGLLDQVDQFDAEFFGIAGREAQLMDPQQRLLLEVVWEALENAGIPPTSLLGSDTAVYVGSTVVDYLHLLLRRLQPSDIDAYLATGNTLNALPGRIAYFLGLRGPSVAMDTACSSSLVAVDRACRTLRDGDSRLAVAAGVNVILSGEFLESFGVWGVLSPEGRCKTFDASADGFVRAEGCSVLLLKRLSHAVADGDRVLALVRGSAVTHDGASAGFTVPNGVAQADAIRRALASGGVAPLDVSYVEAHGTGTQLGDPIEMEAIADVYAKGRDRARALTVGAVKPNIGHCEAASGIAGMIKVILSMQHRQIPPSIHFSTPTPQIPWNDFAVRVPQALEPWQSAGAPLMAGVSAFGFSGTNAHVVLEEAPVEPRLEMPATSPSLVLTLSARSESGLAALAARYADRLASCDDRETTAVCIAASAGRAHLNHRLAVVAADTSELVARLRVAAAGDDAPGISRGRTSGRTTRVAFLFSGQGAQFTGMARALRDQDEVFRVAFDRCTSIMDPMLGRSLADVMFDASPDELNQTRFAQPALFAVAWGLIEMWRSRGVTPSVLIGHSIGEFAAAACAGVLSIDDAARLVVERGRVMQELPSGGAMAAVFASESDVETAIAAVDGVVALAGVNAANETVISGDAAAVDAVCATFAARGVTSQRLPVSHAFHSPLMQEAAERFRAIAATTTVSAPTVSIVSTVTGARADAEWGRPGYWARQILSPVRFADALRTAVASGIDVALELGPHPVLTALGERSLPDAEVTWTPSLRRGRDDAATAAAAVAALYVRGALDDWSGKRGAAFRSRVALPNYPFQRSRFWVDAPAAEARGDSAADWVHPLLGRRVSLATGDTVFEGEAGHASQRTLRDHVINGRFVWPATATVEMALAAARDAGANTLERVAFTAPLVIEGESPVRVQTVVRASAAERQVELYHASGSTAGRWVSFASAAIGSPVSAQAPVTPVDVKAMRGAAVDLDHFYDGVRRIGLEFGPAFRSVRAAWVKPLDAIGEVCLPEGESGEGFLLHPILLDGCFHVAFLAAGASAELMVPRDIGRITVHQGGTQRVWCHATVTAVDGATMRADLVISDSTGARIADVEGLTLAKAGGALGAQAPRGLMQTDGFEIQWRAVAADGPTTRATWIVIANDASISRDLVARLEQRGDTAFAVRIEAKGMSRAQARMLFATVGAKLATAVDHVVFAPSCPDAVAGDSDLAAFRPSVETALSLIQDCAEHGTPRVWLITRDAQRVAPDERASAVPAALWGLGRTAHAEHPELACTLVDTSAATGAAFLADVLRATTRNETQIAVRDQTRYVARLARAGHIAEHRAVIRDAGSIDAVALEEFEASAPAAHEVRIDIDAAGLNFRDVLGAVGMYPGAVSTLGGECAGVVRDTGAAVTSVRAGDAVMAFAPGGLATCAVVDERFVTRVPEGFDAVHAAALPIAYMTAVYALEDLAKLKAGERVLIHAATGGVGMAAVHVARRLGAEIFATAGSDDKRRFLRELGIEHVFDSRSLAFRDEVRASTDGRGVDVVLNSLAGDFVAASLDVMAPGGRFLEMGKRDVLSQDAVSRTHPGVSYVAFDVGDDARRDPSIAQSLLTRIRERIDARELPELPTTVYDLSHVRDAMRLMAQARHMGKIVLAQNVTQRARPVRITPDATYLVVGGHGSIGLAIAGGIAERGGKHIVLASRTEPTDAVRETIAGFTADGVDMRSISIDVSDHAAVKQLVKQLLDSPHPLRGICHAAGAVDDAVLEEQHWGRFKSVMSAKVGGALNLDSVSRSGTLDFFALCSAGAGWLGSRAQANYAAANTALDAIAVARRSAGERAVSIVWGRWEGGIAASDAAVRTLDALGVTPIGATEGVRAFFDVLDRDVPVAGIMKVDWQKFIPQVYADRAPGFFAEIVSIAPVRTTAAFVRDVLAAPSAQRRERVRRNIEGVLRPIVGVPAGRAIDPRSALRELGMDSLMTVELRNALSRALDHTLPATLLFDYPTLDALAEYLLTTVPVFASSISPVVDEVRAAPDNGAGAVAALSESEAEAQLLRELTGGA